MLKKVYLFVNNGYTLVDKFIKNKTLVWLW